MRRPVSRHDLDGEHAFYVGSLPDDLKLPSEGFDELWHLHPAEYHVVRPYGRATKTARWQQAYGRDYYYTGRVNPALPIPLIIQPFVQWYQETIDRRLNGVLVNWYDGSLGHRIGHHRDSTRNMIRGVPIVTISFGQERVFRLRPWKGKGYRDFQACDSVVFVMPYGTNLIWTHEVPHSTKCLGRRISVTFRGFLADG